jgi:hypothetical protein
MFDESKDVEADNLLGNSILAVTYNVNGVPTAQLFARSGLRLPDAYRSNFLPFFFDLRRFLAAHDLLKGPFERRYRTSLPVFIATIWRLGRLTGC